jgi:precorrin-4 C11-methyltransferase
MSKQAVIVVSQAGYPLADRICKELPDAQIFTHTKEVESLFHTCEALVFVGAMGICVRSIAPYITDKHSDPAVVCVDTTGRYVVPVLSGHVGGANELSRRIARAIGGEAVVTTQSDNTGLWALDTLGRQFGWETETKAANFNHPLTAFVNKRPTALLLDIRDKGTDYLERSRPAHVDVYTSYAAIDTSRYELLIAVSPFLYPVDGLQAIYYRPKVLHLGFGCRKDCCAEGVADYILEALRRQGIHPASIRDISSIELKKDEATLAELQSQLNIPLRIYTAEELQGIEAPNPSAKVEEVTSTPGVCEPAAIRSAAGGPLLVEKQKAALSRGNEFTFALAFSREALRGGHIEIVGAGPGDPDLISLRGRQFLETADLILYAGSLVPEELTHCAKPQALVRSSAAMTLEEQFELMRSFYEQGKLVVRLHTGDPCIYGAIQEQMAFFDAHGFSYHITPGISSFQAAAAALRSQFTIPEKVQSIILTRGEGRTPMPEKEQLRRLAASQSTMCIFLSAGIAEEVQAQLLTHYPPETPVAVCYKLTWKDERIYRGILRDLASIVRDNRLTLTTLIVVGEAIGNRHGLSRLYAAEFKHIFRP